MNDKLELIKEISSSSNPYYGGSVAYLQAGINLALLSKLSSIKCKSKKETNKALYSTLKTISDSLLDESMFLVEEDGNDFAKLKELQQGEEKDAFLMKILDRNLAYIINLNNLDHYLIQAISSLKGSIVNDYIMIKNSIIACKENLLSIYNYEANMLSNIEKRQERLTLTLSAIENSNWKEKYYEKLPWMERKKAAYRFEK